MVMMDTEEGSCCYILYHIWLNINYKHHHGLWSTTVWISDLFFFTEESFGSGQTPCLGEWSWIRIKSTGPSYLKSFKTRSHHVPKFDLVLKPVPLPTWHRELHPPFSQLARLRPLHPGLGHAAHSALPAELRLPAPVPPPQPQRAPRMVPDRHGCLVLYAQQPSPSPRLVLLPQPARQHQHGPGSRVHLPEPAGSRERGTDGSVRRRSGASCRWVLLQSLRLCESGDGDVLLDTRTVWERGDQSAGPTRMPGREEVQSGWVTQYFIFIYYVENSSMLLLIALCFSFFLILTKQQKYKIYVKNELLHKWTHDNYWPVCLLKIGFNSQFQMICS